MTMRKLSLLGLASTVLLGACSDNSGATFSIKGSTNAVSTSSFGEILVRPFVNSGSPTEFKITVYAAYVAESVTCTNPVLLQDYGSDGLEVDMYAAPTLFSGSPTGGTYNCMILEFNDNLKFKVDATAVTDHAGCVDTTTAYTHNIYRNGDSDDGTWIDPNGTAIDATGTRAAPGTGDRVASFATTGASQAGVVAGGNAVSANQWMQLSGALTVPGEITYFWDATGGISNSNDLGTDYCVIEEVATGFR